MVRAYQDIDQFWLCQCGAEYMTEEEAEKCCTEKNYQCPNCRIPYFTSKEATECCSQDETEDKEFDEPGSEPFGGKR